MNNPKIEDLRWSRVFTPIHIPKYLVDRRIKFRINHLKIQMSKL